MCCETCECSTERNGPQRDGSDCLPGSTKEQVETLELLSELWVTGGVAIPTFLAITSVVLVAIPRNGVILEGWLLPSVSGVLALVFVLLFEVIGNPLREESSADETVRSEIHGRLSMCVVGLLISGCIMVAVLGILDSVFIAKMVEDRSMMPGIDVSAVLVLRESMYTMMGVLSTGTGFLAGSVRGGVVHRLGYAGLMAGIAFTVVFSLGAV